MSHQDRNNILAAYIHLDERRLTLPEGLIILMPIEKEQSGRLSLPTTDRFEFKINANHLINHHITACNPLF
jgi:hypothetical protein